MNDHADFDPQSRREFLRLMGASLAMSSFAGCFRPPQETIVPHVEYPEYSPSEALQFATAMPRGGYGLGVLATSRAGRPTKIEGNPLHPSSLGATDAFAQASILGLYDPDRSQTAIYRGTIDTWERFLTEMAAYSQELKDRRGEGLRILTETVTSPTLGEQLLGLLDELPRAVWHQYEPVGLDNVREGCRLAFGRYVQPRWRFDRADLILALDSDFLFELPSSVRYAREFIDRRRVSGDASSMNRLYVLESTPTITGAMADHRLPLKPSLIERVVRALLARMQGQQAEPQDLGVPTAWLTTLAEDLQSHRGSGLVIAGPGQPPQVHALVWALNAALNNVGRTVTLHEPVEARPENHRESLANLVSAMQAGEVETLVILGGNPVYSTPGEFDFQAGLAKVKQRIHLSQYNDETSFLCDWHIPAAHYLESWSDVRAFDGTATIIQPLIEPLYASRTAHEIVALLRGQTGRSAYQIVQEHWKTEIGERDFAAAWRRALHDGVVAGTEAAEVNAQVTEAAPAETSAQQSGLEIEWRPDPTVWDGSYANNAWLQELPKPLSKITWDNAAYVSPQTAQRLGFASGDTVQIAVGDRSLIAPVWIMPGQADDCISLTLGYGRTRGGQVAKDVGYSADAIRPASDAWFITDATVQKVPGRHRLATTQDHHNISGRDIVRVTSLAEFQ